MSISNSIINTDADDGPIGFPISLLQFLSPGTPHPPSFDSIHFNPADVILSTSNYDDAGSDSEDGDF